MAASMASSALASREVNTSAPYWAWVSGLFHPAALLVGLPISGIETLRLGLGPALARRRDRIRIVAVKQKDQTLISGGIGGERRPVDQKADLRAIGIVVAAGDQDRLRCRFRLLRRAMWQETVVTIGPQMGIESLDAFFGRSL